MSSRWPDERSRILYVRYLELELMLMEKASKGQDATALVNELDNLLRRHFPRSAAFIKRRLDSGDPAAVLNEARFVVWAEARSRTNKAGRAVVEGKWTKKEIAEDINDCFREAKERLRLCGHEIS